MNPTSLLYWYPILLAAGGIRMPQTRIVLLPEPVDASLLMETWLPQEVERECEAAAEALGYPCFLRTDLISGKHSYRDTCYVPSFGDLYRHIGAVLEEHGLALWMEGPSGSVSALVFREMLQLASLFSAWNGLPIAPERRYFVGEGKVRCHHSYWIDAENVANAAPSAENWRDLLTEMNTDLPGEHEELSGIAQHVSRLLPGEWSVDFAMADDGNWYLIDMAVADQSWHPDHS